MVTRYLAVINSSSNFIIYCVAGKQFRTVLAILFHLRSGRPVQNLAAVKLHHKIIKQQFAQLLLQEQNRKTDIPVRLENCSEMCENFVGTNQTPAVSCTEGFELISTDV